MNANYTNAHQCGCNRSGLNACSMHFERPVWTGLHSWRTASALQKRSPLTPPNRMEEQCSLNSYESQEKISSLLTTTRSVDGLHPSQTQGTVLQFTATGHKRPTKRSSSARKHHSPEQTSSSAESQNPQLSLLRETHSGPYSAHFSGQRMVNILGTS